VKAEEYEAAVNALLEALGLDPALTLEVRVQPHKATAKVLLTADAFEYQPEKADYKFTGLIYQDVVVERDDIVDYIPTVNAAKVEVEALKLSSKSDAKELTDADKAKALYNLAIKGQGPKGYLI
jgi:hypothetical protein